MRHLLVSAACSIVVAASCASDDSAVDDSSAGTEASSPASDTATATTEPAPASTTAETTSPTATDPIDTAPPETSAPETAPPTTEVLATFEPIGFGEYDVGVTTITITDEARDRPLTVDVWFPLAEGTTGDPHRYTFVTGDYYQSPDAITAEASSISPDGPFPLVVYSHGSGGQRYVASNYTETIASHGYLVVAPDHTGNTAVERIADTADPTPLIALNRPRDVRVVIDSMRDPEDPETSGFVASTDPERLVVTGHSFGGFTAYASASGYENDLGSVEPAPGLDGIIPLAPAVGSDDPNQQLLTDEQLARVNVPALVIAATNDQTTPIEPNVRRAWELTSSDPHYRVELIDAQHQTFTDLCDYLDFFPTLPEPNPLVIQAVEALATEGCSPGDMPIARAEELTNTFAISFLDSLFDGREMIDSGVGESVDDITYLVMDGTAAE
jgi:predicted dienelactone hydrolase